MVSKITKWLESVLEGKKLLLVLGVIYVFSCVAIAYVTKHDVPHDERYHFTLTKRMTSEATPLVSSTRIGDEAFGDLHRNTSLLYHYLLSKPLIITKEFIENESVQIFILRLINVCISIATLYFVHRLVVKVTKSYSMATLVASMTAFSTIFMFISSSISYDNFVTFLFVLSLYYAIDILSQSRNLAKLLNKLGVTIIAGTLVKQTFLIFALLYAVFFAVNFGSSILRHISNISSYIPSMRRQLITYCRQNKLLIIISIILLFLFVERYGLNMYRYKSPVPDCDQLHSIESCKNWPAYARNMKLKDTLHERSVDKNALGYSLHWYNEIGRRINGVYTGWSIKHDTFLVRIFMVVSPIIALYLYMVNFKKYRKKKWLQLSVFMFTGFGAFLLLHNYTAYVEYRYPVAIQSRYLMPLLPILYLFIVYLMRDSLKSKSGRTWFTLIILICFMSAGGVSYFQLTDNRWYRDNRSAIVTANRIKKLTSPLNILLIKD